MNLLFVCSRNQWRSPTAEFIYKKHSCLSVRSAGTAASARVKLTAKDIYWADLIFVMEKKHRQKMIELFPSETGHKKIIVLNIADEYQFMDEELISEIQTGVETYLPI